MCILFYPEVLSISVYDLLEVVSKELAPICQLDLLINKHFTKCVFPNLSWLYDKPKHDLFLHEALDNDEFHLVVDPSNLDVILDNWLGYVDYLFVLTATDGSYVPYINETKLSFKCSKIDLNKSIEDNMTIIRKKVKKHNYEEVISFGLE